MRKVQAIAACVLFGAAAPAAGQSLSQEEAKALIGERRDDYAQLTGTAVAASKCGLFPPGWSEMMVKYLQSYLDLMYIQYGVHEEPRDKTYASRLSDLAEKKATSEYCDEIRSDPLRSAHMKQALTNAFLAGPPQP